MTTISRPHAPLLAVQSTVPTRRPNLPPETLSWRHTGPSVRLCMQYELRLHTQPGSVSGSIEQRQRQREFERATYNAMIHVPLPTVLGNDCDVSVTTLPRRMRRAHEARAGRESSPENTCTSLVSSTCLQQMVSERQIAEKYACARVMMYVQLDSGIARDLLVLAYACA